MNDCKTCAHATVLYHNEKEGERFADAYSPAGYIRCKGPRYKGRAYFCKDSKKACTEYTPRERSTS